MPPTRPLAVLCALACAWLALPGVAAHAQQTLPERPVLPWGEDPPLGPALARAAALSAAGRALFHDPGLSASNGLACAGCHDPANHFAPANGLSVQRGGAHLERAGTRAVPTLTYASGTAAFTEHFHDSEDDGDEGVDQGPAGGRTWDGRVATAREQAAIPLLAAHEMANRSEADVVAHVAAAPYAVQLRLAFGETVFADTHTAFLKICEALEAYQQEPAEFSAYTSKYDAFLRGLTALSAQEVRGLAAFNDPRRGNCQSCHRSALTPVGNLPLFTDAGYVALGLPRNPAIPANHDPAYYDLGLCGPDRRDLAGRDEYCGLFKAPTLRNVATRHAFYHNGVFHTLEDAVAFYATRDTDPARWYPRDAKGRIQKFNDLPERYRRNVSREAPFGGRPGARPALSPADVADIVAFLRTLTDGYDPAMGPRPSQPAP